MTTAGRLIARLTAVAGAGAVAAATAAAAGAAGADRAAAASAAAVVAAGLLLAPGASSGPSSGPRWPPRETPEPTSAGWHDIRLLADAMARAPRDAAVRSEITGRIRAALGQPPLGRPATRRDLDRALAALAVAPPARTHP